MEQRKSTVDREFPHAPTRWYLRASAPAVKQIGNADCQRNRCINAPTFPVGARPSVGFDFIIHTDGGSRGNPGGTAWLLNQYPPKADHAKRGNMANRSASPQTTAEYQAVMPQETQGAHRQSKSRACKRTRQMDSELIERQPQRTYQNHGRTDGEVLHPNLESQDGLRFSPEHVYRESTPPPTEWSTPHSIKKQTSCCSNANQNHIIF